MSNLIELIDHAHDLTASSAAFLICMSALAVVWKALGIVAKSQRKKPPRRIP
jgi:hypothetical protein